ncbi:MAG: L,D-transpeptidase family protein [Verrucomicrobiales bacterium]
MSRKILFLFLSLSLLSSAASSADAPPPTGQILLSVPNSWNSKTGKLKAFHWDGKEWKQSFKSSIDVLYGRNGLAWGRGVMPAPSGGSVKKEGDGKAPAGFFAVPKVLGYAGKLPGGSKGIPYRSVTKWDAWIDDPKNPYYNKHYVADPGNVPSWFNSQKMRHGDFAYEWLIQIDHNANTPKPGAGSAIFFHVRRGPSRYTSGCTTMRKEQLEEIIKWLNPEMKPHYVLLPRAEYEKLKGPWNLPEFGN